MYKRESRQTPEGQIKILKDHAENPRNRGLLPKLPYIGVRDLEGFAELQIQLDFQDGKFATVRWDGRGPSVFLAASSILCSWLEGRSWDDYQKMIDLWTKQMLRKLEIVDKTDFAGDLRAFEYVIRERPGLVRELELPWDGVAKLTAGLEIEIAEAAVAAKAAEAADAPEAPEAPAEA